MIGLLDPALFLSRPDDEVERDLALVVRTCREHPVQLVPIEEYWRDLWRDLAYPLERNAGPSAKRAVQEVRNIASRSTLRVPPLELGIQRAWRAGFRQLFAYPALGSGWEERMANATLRAVATRQQVVVLSRRVIGRNLTSHAAEYTTLEENTRWVLHVQPMGVGHRQVLCVYHPRNLTEHWTTRFDWRLPAASDRCPYPFCPPDKWWKGSTSAHRTVASKPAWLDKHGNGWSRPNTPGAARHWDVIIPTIALQKQVGLSQINVVQFGAPAAEGKPGHLHHVPGEKAGKTTGTGWCC